MKDDTRLANYTIAYVATLLFFSVGGITTLGFDWYLALTLPVWMPPNIFVASVWGVLFFFTAWSACLAWITTEKVEVR